MGSTGGPSWMIRKKGFDTEKYLDAQVRRILNEFPSFDKLYLELGGKLRYDNHGFTCTSRI